MECEETDSLCGLVSPDSRSSCVFGFEGFGWKNTFGWMQDPQLTTEQSQTVPDTQEVIPEGTTSLVDGIKVTVRSVYPERGTAHLSV